MEVFYSGTININQVYWGQAEIDQRFFSGDQDLMNELYGNVPMMRKKNFTFNRIRPIINMVSGQQRKTRKSIICTPIENGDNETADQFTKIIMWNNKKEGVLETVSEAFEGALVAGMNLLQVWMDYREDPVCGNIKVDNCHYNSFLIDPYFRKADLSDCNGIWKRSYLSKRECISLLPNKTDEILQLTAPEDGVARDGKFQYMPENYNMGFKNLLTYDEFWYRDYRMQKMLVDAQTGETMEWKSPDDEKLSLFLQTYPSVTIIEQEIPTVRLGIVVEGKVMFDGANPLGIDLYPFCPVLGYYNPQMNDFSQRIQGMVRSLRDPQFLYNHRKAIEFDIFESQINSGFKYKENALVNPADVFLSGQGRGLALKSDAAMSDVEQIRVPGIPPQMLQMSEIMAKELPQISGVSEELLGSNVQDMAGILSMLRQDAGRTGLQGLFDRLDRSTELLGRICIDLIQANFTPGKVKKILEGAEPTQQFYNKDFGKYHAMVEEGLNTSSQKQMQFAQMIQLKEMGVPISAQDLLEAATFPNKDRVIKNVEQAEQAQQAQQQAESQSQIQLQQAQIELANARAKADIGLYNERTSRVAENRALAIQKIHESNRDDDVASLNKIKAMKELETMDLAHIEKLVGMVNSIKEQGVANVESQVANS